MGKQVHLVEVSRGRCESCGYDYGKLKLEIGDYSWPVICPRCGNFSTDWDSDTPAPEDPYDLEKENGKTCPVCHQPVDYHTMGFIHYQDENAWVHISHNAEETAQGLGRPLSDMEKWWIEH